MTSLCCSRDTSLTGGKGVLFLALLRGKTDPSLARRTSAGIAAYR